MTNSSAEAIPRPRAPTVGPVSVAARFPLSRLGSTRRARIPLPCPCQNTGQIGDLSLANGVKCRSFPQFRSQFGIDHELFVLFDHRLFELLVGPFIQRLKSPGGHQAAPRGESIEFIGGPS